MSGVREVIETFHVPLDPSKDFRLPLPERFLLDESHRDRVVQVWNKDVLPTINNLCRARKSGFINKSLKRSVFCSGMDNVCKDFSRRTDNINVQFRQAESTHQYHHSRKTIAYSLVFTRLSAVTQSNRNARACVAEIPVNPLTLPVVQAEVMTTDTQPSLEASASDIPAAHSEIISTHVPIYQCGDADEAYMNPPVASAVTVIVEAEDDDEQESMVHSDRDYRRTALQRMQELESIKTYLTEAEYTAKRQAILESI